MIITKTPLRISFTGGGTDLPAYYEQGYDLGKKAAADFMQQQARDGGRLSGAYR